MAHHTPSHRKAKLTGEGGSRISEAERKKLRGVGKSARKAKLTGEGGARISHAERKKLMRKSGGAGGFRDVQ